MLAIPTLIHRALLDAQIKMDPGFRRDDIHSVGHAERCSSFRRKPESIVIFSSDQDGSRLSPG
jgi:hypothetical protein